MTWEFYIKTANAHAKRVLIEELTYLRDRAADAQEVANLKTDVEGRTYFRERKFLLDDLIKVLDPEYLKDGECT